jgi:hypothetical protein
VAIEGQLLRVLLMKPPACPSSVSHRADCLVGFGAADQHCAPRAERPKAAIRLFAVFYRAERAEGATLVAVRHRSRNKARCYGRRLPAGRRPAQATYGGRGCSRSASSETRVACHTSQAANCPIGRSAVSTIRATVPPADRDRRAAVRAVPGKYGVLRAVARKLSAPVRGRQVASARPRSPSGPELVAVVGRVPGHRKSGTLRRRRSGRPCRSGPTRLRARITRLSPRAANQRSGPREQLGALLGDVPASGENERLRAKGARWGLLLKLGSSLVENKIKEEETKR